MIPFTARGFDTYALSLQMMYWWIPEAYSSLCAGCGWSIMCSWCQYEFFNVFLPYAVAERRDRIQHQQWPEASDYYYKTGVHVFASNLCCPNKIFPHEYVPWPDFCALRANAYQQEPRIWRWVRRVRLFAAQKALLPRFRYNRDLVDQVLAHANI